VRGSPLLRALAAFLVIAALGWPLEKLTHRSKAMLLPQVAPAADQKPVLVSFRFTHLPRRVAIWHLGKEKWTSTVNESEIEFELKLDWPREGIDLRVVVDWAEGAPLAGAQIRVIDPEGTEHTGSIFSKGPADEVLTFR
jgi:hypothetical protein